MALNTAKETLNALLPEWHLLLQGWSADGSLVSAAQEALMLSGEPPALRDLVTQWSAGDFTRIPPIELLSSAEMNGAMGAYAISTGTIYLNADWLAGASKEAVNAVLTEELGHYLDAQLNAVDTPGDEGEYFSKLLSRQALSYQEKVALRREIDQSTISRRGEKIIAEQASSANWSAASNCISTDIAWSIAVSSQGEAYIGGYTEGAYGVFSVQAFNGGYSDGHLTKFNADGTVAWTRLIGSSNADQVKGVAIASNGDIVASGWTEGSFDGQSHNGWYDGFITKYSPDGTRQWTRILGTSQSDGVSAITIDDGYIYATGATGGNLDGIAVQGGGDAFLTKLDLSGNRIWTRLYGSTTQGDDSRAITTDNQGYIYMAGYTNGDFPGITSNGSLDGFVSKYDKDGSQIWSRLIGGAYGEIIGGITTGADGSIYVCGYTESNLNGETNQGGDGFVVKLDSNGSTLWTRLIGGAQGDSASAVTIDNNGVVLVSGQTSSDSLDGLATSGGPQDAFVAAFAPDGTRQWTRLFGGQYGDEATGIRTGSDNSIYICGVTSGDYEGVGAPMGGQIDSFVTRFTNNSSPTDISLASSGILEDSSAGAVIGTLAASDPDAGATFTYALVIGNGINDADNALVEIVGNEVRVKSGASIDYESNPVLNLNIQVTDNGTPELKFTKALTANVLNINEAPTNLTLTTSGVLENSPAGTAIGTLSATDPDAGSSFTYALVTGNGTNDADNALVQIVGNEVRVKSGAVIDYETNPVLNLNIQVTDNGTPGLTFTKAVTAAVLDVVNEDTTAPTITDISVQGTAVTLTFSELIQSTGINTSTFSIKVDGTPKTVSASDTSNPNKVRLTISGTAPASSSSLQVSYSGTTPNIIKDLAGNSLGTFSNRSADSFFSGASVTSLYTDYTNLTLTGTSAINGTGNGKNNAITGNQAKNTINGAGGADVLTGLGGTDTFVYTTLANSLLGSQNGYTFDRITDFAIGQDKIDGPKTVSITQFQRLGAVAALDQAGLQAVLTSTKFVANGAASFTFDDGGKVRTFVAMNDGVVAFDVTKDAVVEITGYSGLLTTLSVV